MKYEIFDHTADIRIHILGNTFDEIFNNAVEAFCDLTLDTSSLKADRKTDISLSSNSPELLLVDLLSRILYYFEADGILYFIPALKTEEQGRRVSGTLMGCIPGDVPEYRNVIKAVTYHGVSVSPEKGFAEVVFDI